jgi:hypothetical protein
VLTGRHSRQRAFCPVRALEIFAADPAQRAAIRRVFSNPAGCRTWVPVSTSGRCADFDGRHLLSDLAPLAAEMLRFAVADLSSPSDRERHAAERFFASPDSSLDLWCAVLRLDADAVRAAVRAQPTTQLATPTAQIAAPKRRAPHRVSRPRRPKAVVTGALPWGF